MSISSHILEAYLHCPTKCWLMSRDEVGEDNVYAEWMREKNQAYRANGLNCLSVGLQAGEYISTPPANLNFKTASWRLASEITAISNELVSSIHAVERTPPEGRGKAARFVPIRFVATNKLTKLDKLLIAFDAHVLAETIKREITHGKIIHGDGFSTLKVKISVLLGEVKKHIGKISSLLTGDMPPDLILNRHCPECGYQRRCREKALEKDDLSLLGGMSEKERKKLNSKGIFTVTQLSYTFRPRRRPKKMRDKQEKYHHSLKALAIREKKIHIVGTPELYIEGTPVYLDVEGLPDRDFYYLIGIRFRQGDSVVQHSLWADRREDEEKIWGEFVELLATIEKPVLIHYGSYETTFIKTMCSRYAASCNSKLYSIQTSEVFETSEVSPLPLAINLLSVIYAHVYFPVTSNGLKEIAGYSGFQWSETLASGLQSIVWREKWEVSEEMAEQEKLIRYNAEDCEALELVTQRVSRLGCIQTESKFEDTDVVDTSKLKRDHLFGFKRNTFILPELDTINKAAYWDYQRERIYVRAGKVKQKPNRRLTQQKNISHIEKTVIWERSIICPVCKLSICNKGPKQSKTPYEIIFGRRSLKLRLITYIFQTSICLKCGLTFGVPDRFKVYRNYGWNLISYILYQIVELYIPQRTVLRNLKQLFDFNMGATALGKLKKKSADYYSETKKLIYNQIIKGNLVNVDETRANIKGNNEFVWVLTSCNEVVYVLSESRDGEIAHKLLEEFKGVLVSDFYTAYDSIDTPQQKCLIHLIRDLNDEVLNFPFDEQLKQIVVDFSELLQPMIETVDRHGLKKHFLGKHLVRVDRFFRKLESTSYQSEAARKCKDRFDRNKDKLFTFLKYDGIPWNNNNAEHAIKAFAQLRGVFGGSSTFKGTEEYLTLLSICQTCKYREINFLDFLRSGERDIDIFTANWRRRRGRLLNKMWSTTSNFQIPESTIYQTDCVIE